MIAARPGSSSAGRQSAHRHGRNGAVHLGAIDTLANPMRTALDAPARSGPARRVLVAGASGFLGRSVVRALSSAGYDVRGLVRDAARGDRVEADGGTPVVGDILDLRTLKSAATGCSGIVHLAANPPAEEDAERVRVDGAANLVRIARQEGVARLVIGSGYWVYGSQSELIDEDCPVAPQGESGVNHAAEREGLEANRTGQLEVLVVRPGMVYGNGSWFRGLAEAIRTGEYRVVGGGSNRWSFIDRWDAGRAFRAVLEEGDPGEVYNAVDGRPAPLREFADFVAAELGVPPPATVTLETAERAVGAIVARHLAADRPTSGAKLRRLGWRPQIPSYRLGVPELLREMFPRDGPVR